MGTDTKPVRFVPEMTRHFRAHWYNKSEPYYKPRRLTPVFNHWPASRRTTRSPTYWSPVLTATYSREALQEATAMIPEWFETADVPRPPQRIRAHSEGIVGRWFTNYWTLHSVKYQCLLAGLPWAHGERKPLVSNYEEPLYFVDFEESRAIRDHRSRWINVHRSMAGMTKKVKETREDDRFKFHKRITDKFWSDRRVFVNRVRSLRAGGEEMEQSTLPLKAFNFQAFDV
jgi:hypothetical protein